MKIEIPIETQSKMYGDTPKFAINAPVDYVDVVFWGSKCPMELANRIKSTLDVTIHSRPVGMTSQAGISPLPDMVRPDLCA